MVSDMFLIVDIGNTNITLGVFDKDEITKKFYISVDISDYETILKSNLTGFNLTDCFIGSVSDEVLAKFKPAVDKILGFDSVIADKNSFKGLNIKTEKPEKKPSSFILFAPCIIIHRIRIKYKRRAATIYSPP